MDLPVVLYGAGERASFEKEQAESYGFKPVCFVDADINKQGGVYLGLPVLSLEQAREKYDLFYIYITPGEIRGEIFNYLIKQGISGERILNYEETEECAGCSELDYKLYVDTSALFTCCPLNDTYSAESEILWKDHDGDMETVVSEYIGMRDNLIRSIKNGEDCKCTGCSFIKNERRPVRKSIKLLALGIDHICQLSCIYCSLKKENIRFYIKDDYDAQAFDYKRFIEILERRGLLSYDTVITWLGGEITINPRIDEILDAVQKYRLNICTNALVYNERIAGLTARPGSGQSISVDAGTRHTYKLVKGADAFDKVWANIKKYTDHGVRVAAKYILLTENSNEADVVGFIHEAVKANVSEVDISADYYRKSALTNDQLNLVAKMLNMAEHNGLPYYMVQTFKPDEQEEILRLKCEMN